MFPTSGFLQISPHGEHPCLRLYPSHHRADSGLSPVRDVRRRAHQKNSAAMLTSIARAVHHPHYIFYINSVIKLFPLPAVSYMLLRTPAGAAVRKTDFLQSRQASTNKKDRLSLTSTFILTFSPRNANSFNTNGTPHIKTQNILVSLHNNVVNCTDAFTITIYSSFIRLLSDQ